MLLVFVGTIIYLKKFLLIIFYNSHGIYLFIKILVVFNYTRIYMFSFSSLNGNFYLC
jgi:hypothetical protein